MRGGRAVTTSCGVNRSTGSARLVPTLGVATVAVLMALTLSPTALGATPAQPRTLTGGVPSVLHNNLPGPGASPVRPPACLAAQRGARDAGCSLAPGSSGSSYLTGGREPIGNWTQVKPPNAPSNRSDPALVFDPKAGYLVLFGGTTLNDSVSGGGVALNDTWTFSGGVWTNLSIPGPSAGGGVAMTYDPAIGCILLFGGVGNNHTSLPGSPLYLSSQTWEFCQGRWNLLPIYGPDARYVASMTYDAADGYVLMWGGLGYSPSDGNQSWSFAEGQWRSLGTGGPSASIQDGNVAMAYDAAIGAVVLADDAQALNSNTTWEFVAGKWSQLEVSQPNLLWSAMSYDPINNLLLLFGGASASSPNAGHSTNQTWGFQNGAWANLEIPGPPARIGPAMAFDPADGGVVLFGGDDLWVPPPTTGNGNFGDTWEFAGAPVNVSIGISVSPASICSVNAPTCPAGTVNSQVSLTAEVITPSRYGGSAPGVALEFGPFHWLPDPGLRFEPWQNVTIDTTLPMRVACATPWGTWSCPAATANTTGLSWVWSTHPLSNVLTLGDTWTTSFYIQVEGAHPRTLPVDACVAPGCGTAGSGTVNALYTWFEFSTGSAPARETLSFPAALVTVLPVNNDQSGPSTTAPPPPPAIGPVLPVPPTGVPTPIASPTPPSVIATGAASIPISLQAAAAGILAMGATRVGIRSIPLSQRAGLRQRVAQASRSSAGKRRRLGRDHDSA